MNDTMEMHTLFSNIGKIITSSLDIHKILDGIMEEVRIFFDAENWSLMRLDPVSNELFFVIAQGIDAKAVQNIRLSPGEGIAGIVASTGKSIFVPDTSRDKRFSDKVDRVTGFATRSVMAVPITFQETVYGVMELINRSSGGVFTEMEHLIFQTIADFAGIAFENSALHERALHIGKTDPLTGVNNRARLNEIISDAEKGGDMHRRQQDRGSYVVAVMVDIDDFKAINDTCSHRDGDMVLKKTASLLRTSFRGEDRIFRIGGDEFLVLIHDQYEDNLEKTAVRVREDMQKICTFTSGKNIRVKFSYGIAWGPMNNLSKIIHRADKDMYQSKDVNKT